MVSFRRSCCARMQSTCEWLTCRLDSHVAACLSGLSLSSTLVFQDPVCETLSRPPLPLKHQKENTGKDFDFEPLPLPAPTSHRCRCVATAHLHTFKEASPWQSSTASEKLQSVRCVKKGLTPSTIYTFRVKACSEDGRGVFGPLASPVATLRSVENGGKANTGDTRAGSAAATTARKATGARAQSQAVSEAHEDIRTRDMAREQTMEQALEYARHKVRCTCCAHVPLFASGAVVRGRARPRTPCHIFLRLANLETVTHHLSHKVREEAAEAERAKVRLEAEAMATARAEAQAEVKAREAAEASAREQARVEAELRATTAAESRRQLQEQMVVRAEAHARMDLLSKPRNSAPLALSAPLTQEQRLLEVAQPRVQHIQSVARVGFEPTWPHPYQPEPSSQSLPRSCQRLWFVWLRLTGFESHSWQPVAGLKIEWGGVAAATHYELQWMLTDRFV